LLDPPPNDELKNYGYDPALPAWLHGVHKDPPSPFFTLFTMNTNKHYKHSVSRSEKTVPVRKTNMWILYR
jgi:hypothetical protein